MQNDLTVREHIIKSTPFRQATRNGKGSRRCRRCANHRGFNRKYNINLCRRCFHAKASDIGFQSFD